MKRYRSVFTEETDKEFKHDVSKISGAKLVKFKIDKRGSIFDEPEIDISFLVQKGRYKDTIEFTVALESNKIYEEGIGDDRFETYDDLISHIKQRVIEFKNNALSM